MLVKFTLPGFCVILSTIFFISCSKKSDVASINNAPPLETAILENLKVDATSISFETVAESKVNSFVLVAPTSHGSKKYYIAGTRVDAGAANAFITLSELSPITEQSVEEESETLNLVFNNTKEQVVHVKWDDGQTADFNIIPATSFAISFRDGFQKTISVWKEDRNMAINGINSLIAKSTGMRIKADKPVIQ